MKTLIFFFCLLVTSPAYAMDYEGEIDAFFGLLREGNASQAVDRLYRSNPYIAAVPDQLTNVKTQLNGLTNLVGELVSLTELDTYSMDEQIVFVTYLAIYDRQPVRFEFTFFRIQDGWRIYSMSYDDDLDDDIQSFARLRVVEKFN